MRSLAEPFDGCVDFIVRLDPPVGLGVFIMGLDKGDDVGVEFGGGAMHTALQLLTGQFREPTFHFVDPAA